MSFQAGHQNSEKFGKHGQPWTEVTSINLTAEVFLFVNPRSDVTAKKIKLERPGRQSYEFIKIPQRAPRQEMESDGRGR